VLHDIDVRDGMAYLSYWNDGLVILDIGNGKWGGSPNAPKLVGQLKYDLDDLYRVVEAEGGPGYIRGTHTAWRHNNYVFVGDEVFSATPQGVTLPGLGLGKANGRLHVIDVSDVTKPREVAWFEPKDGGTHNVWVAGDTLYLGDYQGGLRVLDISGDLRGDLLAQDREIAHVHTGDADGMLPNAAMAWGAFYHNGLVWVNDVFSGLWAIRIEPAKKPSFSTNGGRATGAAVVGAGARGASPPPAARRRRPPPSARSGRGEPRAARRARRLQGRRHRSHDAQGSAVDRRHRPDPCPPDSHVTNAAPIGEKAIPCGMRLLVVMRADSFHVRVSNTLTLLSFLFVTNTSRPSGDGSTLYAPVPVGRRRTSSSVRASRTWSSFE
jgi:hypothetical protein